MDDGLAPAAKRFAIVVAVVATVGAVALVAWLARADDDPEPHIARRSVVDEAPTKEPIAPPLLATLVAATASAPSAPGSEQVEVCGLGWVDAAADGSVDPNVLMQRSDAQAARDRLLASLRSDAGGMGESVAIDSELWAPRPNMPLAMQAFCDGQLCPRDDGARAAARALVDRLATVASTTGSADLYAMAYSRCAGMRTEGPCALLSTAQWARLDPGNALPWFFDLEAARARRDRGAIDDALFHIGQSTRFEERPRSALAAIASHAGSGDVDSFVSEQAMSQSLIASFTSAVSLLAVARECKAPIEDANRRQVCDAAATLLTERSDSITGLLIGNLIGRRLGWSDERLDVADMVRASPPVQTRPEPEPESTRPMLSMVAELDCRAVRKRTEHLLALGNIGEVALARQALLAERDREGLRRRVRAERAARIERERQEAATPYSAAPPPAR